MLLRKILHVFNQLVSAEVRSKGMKNNHVTISKRLIDLILTKDPMAM